MTTITIPTQGAPQAVTEAWTALPAWLPVPDLGLLSVNAFVLRGREPLLVDTGLQALEAEFLAALAQVVAPEDLRWIWLSHADADHIGNLRPVLERAPRARVVTNFLGAGKMGMMGGFDLSRVHILAEDEVLEVGGRILRPQRPPYCDAPESLGFHDATDGVLFAVDCFGALLPTPVADAEAIPEARLRAGIEAWSAIDVPWLTRLDRAWLRRALADLERLTPAHVLSGHLPPSRDLARLARIVTEIAPVGDTRRVA
ncbi:MBL fold metallo-hydrolase [Zavarzinia compransoris]|uniref:MBL fold metallo-hydrolase n=1 Tax=Zavarzinia marina TaxID=2911065 RepID=UPI001F37559F|nr:MBL fold metallo-hydrolase [Zavarzinia marina]MCF4167088.1 MBL fold metallo-hydrolase [Zavarzinia marina]